MLPAPDVPQIEIDKVPTAHKKDETDRKADRSHGVDVSDQGDMVDWNDSVEKSDQIGKASRSDWTGTAAQVKGDREDDAD
mmetsp:Transcript_66137/g.144188  ORF Transcript_66137/g.144188 Transcript_66137/m.144188 type:complete len:80 (+) Transcript_66137:189-428(+)